MNTLLPLFSLELLHMATLLETIVVPSHKGTFTHSRIAAVSIHSNPAVLRREIHSRKLYQIMQEIKPVLLYSPLLALPWQHISSPLVFSVLLASVGDGTSHASAAAVTWRSAILQRLETHCYGNITEGENIHISF